MKLERKHLIWAVVLVIAGVLGVAVLRPTPIAVETARVERGPLRVTLDEDGRTRVRNRYVVVAPVAGTLARIALEPGDSVTEGSVVARLAPAPLDSRGREQAQAVMRAAENSRDAAEAEVRQARAARAQARRNLERVRTLLAQQIGTPVELEQAALADSTAVYAVASAEARARAAAYQIEEAKAALLAAAGPTPGTALPVRAPACGSVLAVPERSARVVAAGTPLLEIGDCSQLEIVVDILTTDAADVRAGARMLVDAWSGDRPPLEARVRRVEPSAFTKVSALGVEEQRVNVIADLLSPPAELGDGFRVDTRVVLWEGEDVLQIPTSALFRTGDGWSVFVVEAGQARVRAVTIGRRNAEAAEIVDGVQEGEVVIRHPSDRVEDGARVEGR